MEIQEILTIERQGIIDTINSYSREYFIRNYTEQLKTMKYPNDKKTLILISERLLNWYDENMSLILSNEFVYNKHEHQKCYELLKSLLFNLKNELTEN